MTTASTPSVLVVEDDPYVQDLARDVLGQAGYEVHLCGGGIDAWPLIRELQPDLLIPDLMLRGVGGLELLVH